MAAGRTIEVTPGAGIELHRADRLVFGSFVDCNMASAWVGESMRIFPGKYGEDPVWGFSAELKYADGPTAEAAFATPPSGFREVALPPNAPPGTPGLHGAVWFETVYSPEPDGQLLYALYHNENYPETLPWDPRSGTGYRDTDGWPPGLLGEESIQAVCRIGLMASTDGGESWTDSGIVLEDLQPRLVLDNTNNTFPGGVGDPSAVVSGDHLYVFYGEYGYPGDLDAAGWDASVEASGQCISVARIPLERLDSPSGAARRWGGTAFDVAPTGVGAAIRSLQIPDADGGGPVSVDGSSFHWGPSVSWNTHLECWVMVMGRVDAGYWKGDSVWVSVNPHADLGRGDASQDWSTPQLLLRCPGETLWYPSLQPTSDADDVARRFTSTRLGSQARLWIKSADADADHYRSDYVATFTRTGA